MTVRRSRLEVLEARMLLTGLPPALPFPASAPAADPALLQVPPGRPAYGPLNDLGIDYGDAPAIYPVLRDDNGAGHRIVAGFYLGQLVNAEPDGQPSVLADADASDDGVIFTPIISGQFTTIYVTASGGGFLDAWMDTNADGDWDDAGEQIFSSEPLVSGLNTLTFRVVGTAVGVPTYARFRLSSSGGLSPTGIANDGEVEDYVVTVERNPWQNPWQPWDVNGDTHVTPLDALLIINLINANPAISFTPLPVPPEPGFAPPPYYDVNGDGYVTPMDVLIIINYLSGGAGEGEAPSGSRFDAFATQGSPPFATDLVLDQGLVVGLRSGMVPAANRDEVASTWFGADDSAGVEANAVFAGLPAPDGRLQVARLPQSSGDDSPRAANLEDLLDDLLRGAEELQLVAGPHARLFARWGA